MVGNPTFVHDNFCYLDLRDRDAQRPGYRPGLGRCNSGTAITDKVEAGSLSAHSIAVAGFLHGRPDGSADAAGAFRNNFCAAVAHPGFADTDYRCTGARCRHRLSAGAELANDIGAVRTRSFDVAHLQVHQREASAGRAGHQPKRARVGRGIGRNHQRHFRYSGFQCAAKTKRTLSRRLD